MIKVTGLSKRYGSHAVVSDVDLTVPAGRLTAMIGPNGAGKSTLLGMIARLIEPTSGDISIDGNDAAGIPIADFAKLVATLRQSPMFSLRLTVEEMVSFGRFPYSRGRLTKDDRRAVDEAIAYLSLQDMRSTLMDELSGGQRQMAFLAMTLAQETPYILLDEPLNNLDMKHAVQVMQSLRDHCDASGKTVVAVIHDINFAANYADHVVAMKNGEISSAGSVSTVVNAAGLGDLYGLEFEIIERPRGFLCNYFLPKG